TPSPPIPVRRSQIAATVSGLSSSRPSGSGMMTKSFSVPWPFTNRMSPECRAGRGGRLPHALERAAGKVGRVEGEPDHPGVAAEPGLLPPGDPAGGPDRLPPGLLLAPLPGEVPQHLRVPERPARRPPLGEPFGEKGADLVDQAGPPHPVDPPLDPLVEHR